MFLNGYFFDSVVRIFRSPESPISMGQRPSSYVVRRARPLTSYSQDIVYQTLPILTKFGMYCSIYRVRRQEIVNFMTPHIKGRENWGKMCKIDLFL